MFWICFQIWNRWVNKGENAQLKQDWASIAAFAVRSLRESLCYSLYFCISLKFSKIKIFVNTLKIATE